MFELEVCHCQLDVMFIYYSAGCFLLNGRFAINCGSILAVMARVGA